VWFGDHPSDPADAADGRTLDAHLGEERLPYLLKILAATKSLSIQAHPTRAQAIEGFDAERSLPEGAPRNYADDNHKPEMIVALSDEFVALCGLREVGATRRLLEDLGPSARPLLDRVTDDDSLAEAVGWLLSGDAQDVVDAMISALAGASSDEFAAEIANARRNAGQFPGDPGVVVGLLMNLMTLGPGEALFLRAGQLHAYQSGLGIEIMAASDNVMRGGLTPKHIDVAELMRVLERSSGDVALVEPRAVADGVSEYPVPVDDFRLWRGAANLDGVTIEPLLPAILLCTSGSLEVRGALESLALSPGQAVFISGDEPGVSVVGKGDFFVAQPGA
jgi:mannose-6-phosphate isomerase